MNKVYVLIMLKESKRIEDKNFKKIGNHNLLEIALNKVLEMKQCDGVYISTSSERYKELIKPIVKDYYRIQIKTIDRPDELSKDNVPNLPVYKHAVENIPDMDDNDYLVHIDACKPFTPIENIDKVIDYANKYKMDSVFACKRLLDNLIGDDAVVTQDKKDFKYIYFNAPRLFTKKAIQNAELGTWGAGEKHVDLPIVNPWEIDIDYYYQLEMARALFKAGYTKQE